MKLCELWRSQINCQEERVDLRIPHSENREKGRKYAQLQFQLNHTMPMTEEYMQVLHTLFEDRIGSGSYVAAPVTIACPDKVHIGNNVFINSNLLLMARGSITIKDDVQIAANVQILSNNHDPYERQVLLCKPVVIEKGAWIGAGATLLPGIRVGNHAIVGAASVVTKDVPDYAVVAGNPARIVKTLDPERFEKETESYARSL